ncbi:MAG: glycosyltransferase family 4 protein [Actinomycetota bacterium]|nr:glycosyltransferase family 4 protein [Actinomycetota bacterium]
MATHVLFLVENQPYPYDPRIRAQVAALVEEGYTVTVAGPTGEGFEAADEVINGVRVRRFQPPPPGHGPFGYAREYAVSLFRLASLTWRTQREDPVDVAFVCNPPDVLVILAVPLARRGAAVVFDDRELSPELFEAKFSREGVVNRLLHRALLWSERFGFLHADAVLVTNQSYASNAFVRGGLGSDRVFVVGNGPDPCRIFPVDERPELRRGRPYLVLWMGAMSKQEGLDRLLAAADELVNRRGRSDVSFAIVGPGDVHEHLASEIARLGLGDAVEVRGRVDDDLVRAYMATADVCVGVDERSSMNDRAAMRKILEYMAMGRPVVQFPLTEMQRICGDATVYAANGDGRDLALKIEALLDAPEERERLGEAARARVTDNRLLWPQQVPALLAAVRTAIDAAASRRGERGVR